MLLPNPVLATPFRHDRIRADGKVEAMIYHEGEDNTLFRVRFKEKGETIDRMTICSTAKFNERFVAC